MIKVKSVLITGRDWHEEFVPEDEEESIAFNANEHCVEVARIRDGKVVEMIGYPLSTLLGWRYLLKTPFSE